MNDKKYLPIIGRGEKMIEPITKKFGFGDATYPRSYQEAKKRIAEQVSTLKKVIHDIPKEKRMAEIVVTIKLNEKFLAKSYIPNTLFKQVEMDNIGSRRWERDDDCEKKHSKMHFVKIHEESLDLFESILAKEESQLTDSFKNDIRKIEEINLISNNEIIQGFDHTWKEGTVEFILHPFGEETNDMLEKFKSILRQNKINGDELKLKSYPNGPTFVSVYVNKKVLNDIMNFNPLRTAHPLNVNFFPEIRSAQSNSLPLSPPPGKNISQIKVGIFDGGIDQNNPFLAKYAKEGTAVGTSAVLAGVEHGTAVAGVILYGDLNNYEANTQLDDPSITVESFRVLPKSNPADLDLYEAIDFIEEIVPSRNDIDVYNLSFGPAGPILDDEISRFTYALDQLAWDHKKLFVVAVGNDGERPRPYNRVQAPADIVNGLGVGAYTFNNKGEKIRASYSCVGGGREGCKVKPDIAAFGGDLHYPIHVLSTNYSDKKLTAGTSFSAPLIASKAAEILGRCKQFSPLVSRALIVHTANNPNKIKGEDELGYGIVDASVDEILRCDENRVNIIYSSSINPTAFAKLPIPLPINADIKGEVHLSWTIATLSKANPLHIEDYTESAIEDTFYPHHKKYKFTKDKNSKVLHCDSEEASELLDNDWSVSSLPNSDSPEQYQTEQARRGEMKWDTVVKKWKRKRISSLEQPFLVLHGMGRNRSTERIHYAAVITITVPKYQGNLYEDILNEYSVLEPVYISSRNEVMIPVG